MYYRRGHNFLPVLQIQRRGSCGGPVIGILWRTSNKNCRSHGAGLCTMHRGTVWNSSGVRIAQHSGWDLWRGSLWKKSKPPPRKVFVFGCVRGTGGEEVRRVCVTHLSMAHLLLCTVVSQMSWYIRFSFAPVDVFIRLRFYRRLKGTNFLEYFQATWPVFR